MKKNQKIQKEIDSVSKNKFLTKRVIAPKLEKVLYKSFKALDHGFVRVIDYMGNDSSIVQAARVSYGKGTKQLNQDKNLINYLLSHRHSTPFEMNEIKFHVKLPIFVARQWIRHRTANVNEYSARYSILDNEFYIPNSKELKPQSKTNNQGRSGDLDENEKKMYMRVLRENSQDSFQKYNFLLNQNDDEAKPDLDRQGLTRELSRIVLPLNSYTQWYWKIDLHNFMHFLALRFDEHAQYEIRVYAEIMMNLMKKWVPLTYEAFLKNRLDSLVLSSEAIKFIKNKFHGKSNKETKISKREVDELKKIFSF
ncbi:MAG: FAD-dependent thymidylate synthase [Alphaproteobacteria bacterium]|nr:FAD-dependent thymidylate synthase [Alphaproteobacteria bacterium]